MRMSLCDVTRLWPVLLIILSQLLSVTESLTCYTCRGVPSYDPDLCFSPVKGRTVRQECGRGEVCETRIHRSEVYEKIIERGCTNNCQGRTYVWTDYFQVHCCLQNDCNAATSLKQNILLWGGCVAIITLCQKLLFR